MKKLILIMIVMVNSYAIGQIQVSLNVDTYPTPEISEWVDRNDLAILTVTNSNPAQEGLQYRIKMRMLKDGAQIFETNNSTEILTLELGTQTFLADEIVPYNSIQFNNSSFENQVLQTGLLPAGQYSFCVKLVNLEGNVISTPPEVCMPMVITDYQMPELLHPIAGSQIESYFLASTSFQWTPLSPQPPAEDGIKYLIAVTEIQPGQTASQAFTINYPVIEEEVLIGTQLNWPLDMVAPEFDQSYVWSIKPLTNNDNSYLNTNNGFVNIETFTIKAAQNLEDTLELEYECECNNGQPIDLSGITPIIIPNDDLTEFAIQIEGTESYLAALTICQVQELSPGEYGTPFNNPYHPSNLSGVVYFNWNETTAFLSVNNDHVYNPNSLIPDPVPEQVLLTFKVINSFLGTSCEIQHLVNIPEEMQIQINGAPLCECTEASGVRPFITLTQPEPSNYPMKLELNNVLELRDYFWGCNQDWDNEVLDMDIEVVWNSEYSETTLNNGPFIYLFTACDSIPDIITVKFKVTNKFGNEEVICILEEQITVPYVFTELNQPCSGSGEINEGDSIFAGADDDTGKGEFAIITTELEEENQTYSGKGTVYIDWMKANMQVEFQGITVDSIGNLISGEIVATKYDDAPVYPQDWALNIVATSPWANNTAQNIIDYVESVSGKSIPFDGLVPLVDPVQLPLGVNFPSGDQFAIVDMVFKYDKSEYNLIAAKTTPPSWDNPVQVVGFIAKNISFHPNDAFEPPIERIELIEDVSIGNMNNNITFTFKAPTSSNSGCYIEWDENGFTEFGVELESSFTREWLLPVPDDGVSRSIARLSAVGSDWEDLLFTGILEKSELVNSQAMTILADSISYDMSDVRNPGSITFPENYEGETSNLFRGFYMKQLEIELPSSWATNTGGQPRVTIEEMIIDDVGVTLYAEATNVISFPNGELVDMYVSIDTLYIDIEASTFREGGMKGRIGLPICKADSIQNPLQYVALLNHPADPNNENYFQLSISPTGPIYTNMLKGELELDPTSIMTAKRYEEGRKVFELNLDGTFSWEDVTLGPIKNVDFGMDFQGMGMNYDSEKQNNKLTLEIGSWGFASPQKFLANFPVTVNKVEFQNTTPLGTEMLRGKLKIFVITNLSDKIGGATQFSILCAIEDKTASGGKKFTPKYINTSIDSINITADMAAVKIKGSLGFRNQDPVYGDGFIGNLDAEFKAGGIKIAALAEFGNTTFGGSNRYRYWRVEADATFPAPGITFLPGVSFRGFGGGAFRNMKSTLNSSNNTYSFEPEESGWGFRANAVLATSPKEETLNMDVGLLGQFSASGGMTFIGFDGDFYVGAGFSSRNNAKIKGDVAVTYDFPQKHFNMSAQVNVNASPITTPNPANLVLDIKGKSNEWYFKFGEPLYLNTVKVFSVNLYEYLMFGNDIPYPNGYTNNFKSAYYAKLGSWPGPGDSHGGVGNNTETGKGFALGIGFMFDASGDLIISKYFNGNKKYTLNYSLGAGAELNLSYMNYLGSCNGYNPVGINGWRAKGGLGFYGLASAGVAKYKMNGDLKEYWNIIALRGGGWIYGEFPNPYYVTGALEGSGDLFGIIEFDFHTDFEKGQKCTNSDAGSGASVTQGDAVAEMQQNLIQYVNPTMSHNFPTDIPLTVKFGLNPDESFDVSEQQSNGTIKMRTFKMIKSHTLKIKNESTGVWETVLINERQNNLGEYLFTAIGQLSSSFDSDFSQPTFTILIDRNSRSSGETNEAGASITSLPIFNMTIANTSENGTYSTPTGFTPSRPETFKGVLSSKEIINSGLTIFPAPPNPGGYSDLPPDPDPVLNNLLVNRNYKFTVTAILKEWNGSSWVDAQKNNGQNVTQTVTKNFRTGPIQADTPSYSPIYSF